METQAAVRFLATNWTLNPESRPIKKAGVVDVARKFGSNGFDWQIEGWFNYLQLFFKTQYSTLIFMNAHTHTLPL